MKYAILCCALFGLIIPAQLMSMEDGASSTVKKRKAYLNFTIDKDYTILRSSAQKMQYCCTKRRFYREKYA